jgi:hypothetical protein
MRRSCFFGCLGSGDRSEDGCPDLAKVSVWPPIRLARGKTIVTLLKKLVFFPSSVYFIERTRSTEMTSSPSAEHSLVVSGQGEVRGRMGLPPPCLIGDLIVRGLDHVRALRCAHTVHHRQMRLFGIGDGTVNRLGYSEINEKTGARLLGRELFQKNTPRTT